MLSQSGDVVSNLNSLLTCSLCISTFTKPVVLPCLHTFCEKCMQTYLASNAVFAHSCPECCKPFERGQPLIRDFFKQNLLELVEKKAYMCKKHQAEQIIRYCRTCDKSLCAECLICESHVNHNIVKVDVIEQETANSIAKCQQKVVEHSISIDSSWENFLTITCKSYDSVANAVKLTINELAENICGFINNESVILKQQVDNICAQKKSFAAQLRCHSSKEAVLQLLSNYTAESFSASLEDRVQLCRGLEAQIAVATESSPNWYLQVPKLKINFEPSPEFRQLTSLGVIKVETSELKKVCI